MISLKMQKAVKIGDFYEGARKHAFVYRLEHPADIECAFTDTVNSLSSSFLLIASNYFGFPSSLADLV